MFFYVFVKSKKLNFTISLLPFNFGTLFSQAFFLSQISRTFLYLKYSLNLGHPFISNIPVSRTSLYQNILVSHEFINFIKHLTISFSYLFIRFSTTTRQQHQTSSSFSSSFYPCIHRQKWNVKLTLITIIRAKEHFHITLT